MDTTHNCYPCVLNQSKLQIEESYQIMLKLGSVERLKKKKAKLEMCDSGMKQEELSSVNRTN